MVVDMSEYYKGTVQDTDDILDFANMVFSMSYKSVDFAGFLPKAYAYDRCEIPVHHMIKEDGKIKAVVDMYPFKLRQYADEIVECEIKAGYIGTVAVHPKSRGNGYMIELMKKAEEQARSEGYDIMLLDGNRHRYQYYGFERAGIKYNFNISQDSIRHCCSRMYEQYKNPVYSFELIDKDSEYLDEMYELYMKRNIIARNRNDFYLCLQSNYSDAYAILKNECFVGYINLSDGETNIHEIELKDIEAMPKVIYDFFEEFCIDEIGVNIGSDELEKIEWLDRMSGYFSMSTSRQIKILDYISVFKFLLKWKQKYTRLSDGKYTIGVYSMQNPYMEDFSHANLCQKHRYWKGMEINFLNDKEIENYSIEINKGDIFVNKTDLHADVIFEEKELVKLLTTGFIWNEINKPDNRLKSAPSDWFPLPFFLPEADSF